MIRARFGAQHPARRDKSESAPQISRIYAISPARRRDEKQEEIIRLVKAGERRAAVIEHAVMMRELRNDR